MGGHGAIVSRCRLMVCLEFKEIKSTVLLPTCEATCKGILTVRCCRVLTGLPTPVLECPLRSC